MRSIVLDSSSSTSSCASDLDEELGEPFQHQPSCDFHEEDWGINDSAALYRIQGWGFPYFFIDNKGELAVRPDGSGFSDGISVKSIIDRVVDGYNGRIVPPMIIRFPQIVRSRVLELQSAFDQAIVRNGYNNRFQGVFPVKCNPDRLLVEEILGAGKQFGFGLEAGSKPELVLAMSALCSKSASSSAFLICNGYKDEEYIELALLARKMGINCILVIELLEEVDMIVRVSLRLGIQPVIGLRSKLSSKHGGHWGETCGDTGKFGLSVVEIVELVRRLRGHGMLHCLQLLHFHIGSQIPCLDVVKESVSEAAHLFCELGSLGANMTVLDIGGGLGIDYDGSASAKSDMSVGYSVQQYAEEVIFAVDAACALKGLKKRPTICCESGRGLVSHHSVLVFDIYSTSTPPPKLIKEELAGMCAHLEECSGEALSPGLGQLCGLIQAESYGLAVEYAKKVKSDAARLFKVGKVNLETRASVERVYEVLNGMVTTPRATYHMNMSMFKSIPDTWAIGQLFPIVPLQRLNEEPTARAILSDLTCDSDGRISAFICGNDSSSKPYASLPVHAVDKQQNGPYYLGLFLAGAYQEALSSMHNLFGSLHVVHVVEDDREGFRVTRDIPGNTIAHVLRTAQHDPACMFDDLRARVVGSLSQGRFESECEARTALQALARTFSSYTYLRTE